MIQRTYTLEFLMPCFCAGANQAHAEVRASSIRGQIRWWFRALGGSASDERAVFGGVAGDASTSALTIRIDAVKRGPEWKLPKPLDIASNAYVYYFASVSGASQRGTIGLRWTEKGVIPPKSTFCLTILQRRTLTQPLQQQLDRALECFLQLGAIGLRVSRGLGSFVCYESPFKQTILDDIRQFDFRTESHPTPLNSEDQIAREIGSLLKGTRKATGYKYDAPSPFGASNPRQTSAVYFRPVRSQSPSGNCILVIFEAPHQRVLGQASRKQLVVGQTPSRFVKPAPGSVRGRGYR